ncbi:MAG: hypothetical protein M1823_002431 [Watsoniomyces obsoletus]|nr:MAG: hypothetical protein M1823_002431 [Watsoniomyces obsoletus]
MEGATSDYGTDVKQYITTGFIGAFFDPERNAEAAASQPVLQCLQIRSLNPQQPGGPERYRIVFSDIDHYVQTMLATQANWLVQGGKLQRGVIVRLKSFHAGAVRGKSILVVLDLEVLEDLGTYEKIGEPKAVQPADGDQQSVGQQPSTISSAGFYGDQAPPQQQQHHQQQIQQQPAQPTSYGGNSGGGGGGGGNRGGSASHPVFPIEGLTPYANKWTIRARCTHKGEVKHWHNKNGEGKLFSVNLLDDTGEIRATGFNDQCDQLYDVFQEGSVYYISSPCKVQMAKKQFTNLNNDYELTFERDTMVVKAEDQASVPQVRFNFTSIGDLMTVEKDTTIDIIGVLKQVDEVSQVTSKTTSKPYDKRELTLVDASGCSVRLTIWGNTATSFDAAEESVIAFKGVRVSDFGNRSLSLLSSGSMSINPDISEAHILRGWYDGSGRTDTFTSYTSMALAAGSGPGKNDLPKTIGQVREENLGMSETVDYFSMKATVVYIKQDTISYPSCLSEGCKRKVFEMEPGQWRCERCEKVWPKPLHRYILSMSVSDHTGQIYLSCFDDVGRIMLGMTADELVEAKEEDGKAALEFFQDACCKTWIFRCRAKMENYQDQQRVRYQVMSAGALNFVDESAKLAQIIASYNDG